MYKSLQLHMQPFSGGGSEGVGGQLTPINF